MTQGNDTMEVRNVHVLMILYAHTGPGQLARSLNPGQNIIQRHSISHDALLSLRYESAVIRQPDGAFVCTLSCRVGGSLHACRSINGRQ